MAGLSAASAYRMMPKSENVKAEFKDSVLRVHQAKSEKARRKQIEVKLN
jgi:HSP20 family molecular chaperone IbpA